MVTLLMGLVTHHAYARFGLRARVQDYGISTEVGLNPAGLKAKHNNNTPTLKRQNTKTMQHQSSLMARHQKYTAPMEHTNNSNRSITKRRNN